MAAGMMVPTMPPHFESVEADLMPRSVAKVAPQNTMSTITMVYILLPASPWSQVWSGPMKASDTAANVSAVGNQIVDSSHSRKIATNPQRGPNASPTQRNTPPFCGQAVASSAATIDTGIRKKTAAKR